MVNLDKTQIGLAGEYYVLAQLSARGFIPTLMIINTIHYGRNSTSTFRNI